MQGPLLKSDSTLCTISDAMENWWRWRVSTPCQKT